MAVNSVQHGFLCNNMRFNQRFEVLNVCARAFPGSASLVLIKLTLFFMNIHAKLHPL